MNHLKLSPVLLGLLAASPAYATLYDYDGDGLADVAVRRASTSYWYIQNTGDDNFNSEQQDGIQREVFGLQDTDIPVPADYDGDGITDIAVRRPSNYTWYVLNSSGDNTNSSREDGIQRQVFGRSENDIPVPADYDGDEIADFAVWRESNATWYVRNSSGSSFNSSREDGIQRISIGQEGDIPVTGDFDGDGYADPAVWRPSNLTWYIQRSSDGILDSVVYGEDEDDIPVPADYDGDGTTDIAYRHPVDFTWHIQRSSDSDEATRTFGRNADDIPIPADYDGDGRDDLAVRRASNQYFYIRNSSDNELQRINFGRQEDDIPANAPVSEVIKKLNDVLGTTDDTTDTGNGDSGSGDGDSGNTNTAPTAHAGSDQILTVGATVLLDGSGSSDSDGDSLTYSWSFSSRPTGSDAELDDSSAVEPSFIADMSGSYSLSLVVNDGTEDSATDSVTITAQEAANNAPVADAGDDQNATVGATITLSGADSTDADGDNLTFSWSFTTRPSGSSATLRNNASESPSFDADVAGNYILSLVVNDGSEDSTADSVTITVTEASDEVIDISLFSNIQSELIDCFLEDQTRTTCYQITVSSADSNFDTEGPYCPDTIDDVGGLGVYDGETNPGFQQMDETLFNSMEEDGYDIVRNNGNIRIQTSLGGKSASAATAYCLALEEADDLTLTYLIPAEPELLDSGTNQINSVEWVGISLEGTPINGEPPSVVERNGNIPSLDPCGGHPDPSGYYHWHFVAQSINEVLDVYDITVNTCQDMAQDETALSGFAKDGFPIYASQEEDGSLPSDLDECNGHYGTTPEYPNGVYHYHASPDTAPNLPSCLKGKVASNSFDVD